MIATRAPAFSPPTAERCPTFPENYSYTTNAYRAGVDFRILPRTTISYDQFLSYFKQDNVVAGNPSRHARRITATSSPTARLSISASSGARRLPRKPCPAPLRSPAPPPRRPQPTPTAMASSSYSQVGRPRNFMPTERLRFQSNYFQKFEMTGSFGYSSSDNEIPDFDEIAQWLYDSQRHAREHHRRTGQGQARLRECGLVRRLRRNGQIAHRGFLPLRQLAHSRHVGHLRNKSFWRCRCGHGRRAGAAAFCCSIRYRPRRLRPLPVSVPLRPIARRAVPLHTTSSGADVTNELSYQFPGTKPEVQHLQLQYDFTPHWSGRIGYFYTNRVISQFSATFDTGETYFPGGSGATAATDYFAARGDCALVGGALPCRMHSRIRTARSPKVHPPISFPKRAMTPPAQLTTINESALLAGFTGRPIEQLRLTGDFSFGYNDASFTRIDPRQVQSYKIHATYTPKPWASLDGAVEIHENRDDVFTVANLEHDRMYSFTAMLAPNPRLAVSFGYNYWDVYTQAEICFNYSITLHEPTPPPASTDGQRLASWRCYYCLHHSWRVSGSGRVRSAFHLRQHRSFRPCAT